MRNCLISQVKMLFIWALNLQINIRLVDKVYLGEVWPLISFFVSQWDQEQVGPSQALVQVQVTVVKGVLRVTPMTPHHAMAILLNQTNMAVQEGMAHLAKVCLSQTFMNSHFNKHCSIVCLKYVSISNFYLKSAKYENRFKIDNKV